MKSIFSGSVVFTVKVFAHAIGDISNCRGSYSGKISGHIYQNEFYTNIQNDQTYFSIDFLFIDRGIGTNVYDQEKNSSIYIYKVELSLPT